MTGAKTQKAEKPTLGAVLDHYGVAYKDTVAGWQTVLCPVVDENRPSCRVNIDTGGFMCQSCGATGGDSLALIMLREQCDFKEALAYASTIPGEKEATESKQFAGRRGQTVTVGRAYRPSYKRRR